MAGSPVSSSRPVRRTLAVILVVALLAGAVGPPVVAATTNDRSNPESLATGQTVETTLPEGEDATHWYTVEVSAGDAVVAELNALNTTNRSVKVQLYDTGGERVNEHRADQICGPDNQAGQVECGARTTAVAPNVAEYTGTYYVKVSKASDPEADRANEVPYNLTVRTHTMDINDPNENGSTATPIGLDERVDGIGAVFDQDVYAVDLEAGVNYTVVVNTTEPDGSDTFSKRLLVGTEAANVTDAEWGDPRARNYTAASSHFQHGERLTFTAETSGTHYVVLGQSGLGYDLLEEDTYRLRVVQTANETGSETGDGGSTDGTEATPTPTPVPPASATAPTVSAPGVTATATDDEPATDDESVPDDEPATDDESAPTATATDDDVTPGPTKTIYPSRSPTRAANAAPGTAGGPGPFDLGIGLDLGTLAVLLGAVALLVGGVVALAVTAGGDDDRL